MTWTTCTVWIRARIVAVLSALAHCDFCFHFVYLLIEIDTTKVEPTPIIGVTLLWVRIIKFWVYILSSALRFKAPTFLK